MNKYLELTNIKEKKISELLHLINDVRDIDFYLKVNAITIEPNKDYKAEQALQKKQLVDTKTLLDQEGKKFIDFKTAINGNQRLQNVDGFKSFLESNNTTQRNSLKRFFGIKKNPLVITSGDRKHLMRVLKEQHQIKELKLNKEIKEIGETIRQTSKIIEYQKLTQNVEDLRLETKELGKNIEIAKQPILKVIENLLDLDIRGLKNVIDTHQLDVKSILKCLYDIIESKVSSLSKEDSKHYKALESNLKELNKENKKKLKV